MKTANRVYRGILLDLEFVERKYYARGVGTVKEEMVRGGNEVVELVEFSAP